ncbi:MAG: glycosyltransferase family 4 protein, partial [Pyrinomonadaceae bacterium]
VRARWPHARVLTNGGNCRSNDINWVHSVHHAWPPSDKDAPAWFKAKNRFAYALACRRERRAIRAARFVVANSERTRRDLIEHLGISPERVRVIYLGSDAKQHQPPTPRERRSARARLGVVDGRPLIVFVGALGHDQNKGFDTLWRAWKIVSARAGWDADLVVAGAGRGLKRWRERIAAEDLGGRVRLIGFTERIGEVYAAADLLVSPARYEAYGLNVHEAVCRGVPALASRTAGVAELYTPELSEMLLPDAEDYADLAARLLRWRGEVEEWKASFAPLSAKLRARGWDEVAAEIISFVEHESHATQGDAAYVVSCTA